MANQGWITIHRKMQKHWIWKEKRIFSKLEAWIDILLTVNHSSKKVLIGNLLLNVDRGDSILSLDSWGKRWNWNKSKVRRFFILLEKDEMIVTKSEQKTTRLTVLKYDSYQTLRNNDETIMKQERNASETQATPNNNDNNNNNNKNKTNSVFNFRKSLLDLGVDKKLVDDWLKVRKVKNATNTETAFNNLKKQFNSCSVDVNTIIEKCVVNSWSGFKKDWLGSEGKNNGFVNPMDKFKKGF